jgi:two-component system, OmpR family, sensor histidine kinase TctE
MKKTYSSLRKKLLLLLVPPLLILILIASSILFRFAIVEQRDAFDNALYDSAYSIYQLIQKSDDSIENLSLPKNEKQFILNDQSDVIFYNVVDTTGKVLNGNTDAGLMPQTNHPATNPYFRDGTVQNLNVRIVTTLVNIQKNGVELPVFIQVAETLNKREALASNVLIDIIVPQLLLVLFTIAIIWFGVERGLQPLFDLQAAVSKRSYLDLSAIELPDVPTEVMILVNSVNSLMRQLESVLNAQNRFIADAAHQLRTPLAGAQAQLELALSESKPEQHQQLLERVSASMERLSHTITQLLSLARNQQDASHNMALTPVNLNQIAQEVTTDMVPTAIKKGLDLGFEADSQKTMVLGDSKRLKEMLYNLVDNAVLYTPAGGKVTVKVQREAGEIVLSVIDNGPGIPKAEREKVFERFHRVMGTGQEGSGLGLSIVMEIAQLHQANVEIADEPRKKGLNIQVSFAEARDLKS